MSDEDLRNILMGTSLCIGALGFCFGVWKDLKIRKIEKLAGAPFFVGEEIVLDIESASRPDGKPWQYHWKTRETKLGDKLSELEYVSKKIPPDYPSPKVAGILLRNEGPKIRKIVSRSDKFFIRDYDRSDGVFELQFVYRKEQVGTRIKVPLWYETEKGLQGKQTWELIVGSTEFNRAKPK